MEIRMCTLTGHPGNIRVPSTTSHLPYCYCDGYYGNDNYLHTGRSENIVTKTVEIAFHFNSFSNSNMMMI